MPLEYQLRGPFNCDAHLFPSFRLPNYDILLIQWQNINVLAKWTEIVEQWGQRLGLGVAFQNYFDKGLLGLSESQYSRSLRCKLPLGNFYLRASVELGWILWKQIRKRSNKVHTRVRTEANLLSDGRSTASTLHLKRTNGTEWRLDAERHAQEDTKLRPLRSPRCSTRKPVNSSPAIQLLRINRHHDAWWRRLPFRLLDARQQ